MLQMPRVPAAGDEQIIYREVQRDVAIEIARPGGGQFEWVMPLAPQQPRHEGAMSRWCDRR